MVEPKFQDKISEADVLSVLNTLIAEAKNAKAEDGEATINVTFEDPHPYLYNIAATITAQLTGKRRSCYSAFHPAPNGAKELTFTYEANRDDSMLKALEDLAETPKFLTLQAQNSAASFPTTGRAHLNAIDASMRQAFTELYKTSMHKEPFNRTKIALSEACSTVLEQGRVLVAENAELEEPLRKLYHTLSYAQQTFSGQIFSRDEVILTPPEILPPAAGPLYTPPLKRLESAIANVQDSLSYRMHDLQGNDENAERARKAIAIMKSDIGEKLNRVTGKIAYKEVESTKLGGATQQEQSQGAQRQFS